MTTILNTIKSPADIKKMTAEELTHLAYEVRQEIISVTSQKGGHVSPNLGVVELSIALHRVFDTPKDKILFDVSHQCYTHKLLTGRNGEGFTNLRQTSGVSGFCNRKESEHDAFGAGHAGTAISAGLGFAVARDLKGTDENVVAVVGDASLTNGLSFEAINNIVTTTKKMIIVLNDNKMSIAKNVGAVAKYLNELITNPTYNKLHEDLNSFLKKLPSGDKIAKITEKVAGDTKGFILDSASMFENFGLTYLGPIDGHDIALVEKYLNFCKNSTRPILLHVITKKGQGLEVAMRNPEKFHGATPYNVITGESTQASSGVLAYQDVMGQTLLKIAKKDPKVLGITAAMASGTGMSYMKEHCANQFFDVGIAEEHAAVFAAGLACEDFSPVVAIYSSFMQRAFDCAMHDICLQELPVVFCMDRAGLSPNDGATHHGIYDISFLRCLPNAILMQPSNEDELADMLYTAIYSKKTCFIRYPRGKGIGKALKDEPALIEIGKARLVNEPSGEIVIWAYGNMLAQAEYVAEKFKAEGVNVGVVDARFAKPLDEDLLLKHSKENKLIVSIEDHCIKGGFGSAISEFLHINNISTPLKIIGWKDEYVEHGTDVDTLRGAYDLMPEQIYATIKTAYKGA